MNYLGGAMAIWPESGFQIIGLPVIGQFPHSQKNIVHIKNHLYLQPINRILEKEDGSNVINRGSDR